AASPTRSSAGKAATRGARSSRRNISDSPARGPTARIRRLPRAASVEFRQPRGQGALMAKKNNDPRKVRLQRTFAVSTLADLEEADRAFWASQTPEARLRAMELMRRINYGKAATGRLQRILEVVQPKKG